MSETAEELRKKEIEIEKAIEKGHEAKAIKLLKKHHFEAFARSGTWLHEAARDGMLKLCGELLDHGEEQSLKLYDSSKRQPLHHAVSKGHADICELLVKRGAPINGRSGYKETPLFIAAFRGNADICRILLAAKARPNMKCNRDKTALHVAADENAAEVWGSIEDRIKIVEMLIDAGIDIESRDDMDATALHYAAYLKDARLLPVLLHAGADIGALNIRERTPLEVAIDERNVEACRMLLEWGADRLAGKRGWILKDALEEAQRKGLKEIEAMLTAAIEKQGMAQDIFDPQTNQDNAASKGGKGRGL